MSAPGPPVLQPRPRTSTGTARFWWSPPLSDGGSAITGYRLSYDSTQISVGNGGSYMLSGLTDGVDYAFSLAAENANGFGPEAYFRVVQCGNKPSAVTAATYTSDASGSFTASWTIPTSDGGAAIRWNVATCTPINPTNGSIVKVTLPGGAANSYQFTGLDPLISYQVLIQAVNDPGYSAPSSYLNPSVYWFDPRDIGTLSLWFDSASPRSVLDINGDPVVQTKRPAHTWVDLVASHQATAVGDDIHYTPRGVGAISGLQFTEATDDGMNIAIPGTPFVQSDNTTVFVVFSYSQPSSGSIQAAILNDYDLFQIYVKDEINITTGIDVFDNQFIDPDGFTLDTPQLLIGYANNSHSVFQFAAPVADLSGSTLRDGTNLTGIGTTGSGLFIGKCIVSDTPHTLIISEILLYDGLLNNSQRQAVANYLIEKWELT